MESVNIEKQMLKIAEVLVKAALLKAWFVSAGSYVDPDA
jgi:hypothetical protein